MPLDPSIALAYRPPQVNVEVPHPLEQFGQVLSLRNMMQQGQLGQLGLQEKLLQLELLKQSTQQRQGLANYLQQNLQGGTQGAAPADTTGPTVPLQTAPPGAYQEPNLMRPAGPEGRAPVTAASDQTAPFGLTGGPESVPGLPNVGAFPSPPPGASLSALMTPQAPGPAVTPTAPAAPAMGGRDGSPFSRLNLGEIVTKFGPVGLEFAKNAIDFQTKQAEAIGKAHDAEAKKWTAMAGAAQAVKAAKNPEAEFTTQLMDLYNGGTISPQEFAALRDHGYKPEVIDGWLNRAISQTDLHNNAKTDAETIGTEQKNASVAVRNATDQPSWTQFYSNAPPRIQAILSPTYSPQQADFVRGWGVSGADVPKMQMGQREANAGPLAAALSRSPAEFQAKLRDMSIDDQALFGGAKTPLEVMQRAQSPDKYVEEARLMRGQLLDAGRLNLERGKFDVDKAKFDAEYGPGTAESAAEQIYANPDSVREVLGKISAGMYPQVQRILKSKYGLPIPVPLEGAAKQQEGAAYGTLTDSQWIRNAMKNPNISKNLGGILGRLQNVEQATGETTGLAGADAQMAQEFRTRMRNMLANEAGAMYKRVNPKVMDDLAKSSGNITMSPEMLSGALDGVEETVKNKLDTLEQSRWGHKMRPAEARGIVVPLAPPKAGDTHPATDGKTYRFKGGDPNVKSNWEPI